MKNHNVRKLKTDQDIDRALSSGEPMAVVGLNGRGMVQLQLPPGNDYIVLTASQARALAESLNAWADQEGM